MDNGQHWWADRERAEVFVSCLEKKTDTCPLVICEYRKTFCMHLSAEAWVPPLFAFQHEDLSEEVKDKSRVPTLSVLLHT